MTNNKTKDKKENKIKLNVVRFENFYKAVSPNITTTQNGILFFNSDSNTIDNAMPQKLQDFRKKSALHSHFLNLKSSLIYASGLYPVDDSNISLAEFLKTKNRAGDSIQKVFKQAAIDMAIYEQCYVEVIYNAEGKIAELYTKSVNDMRVGETNEYGVPDFYYFSKTWGDVTNQTDRKKVNDVANAVKIPAFKLDTSEPRQILHIKKYDSCNGVYPEPSYLAADYWINVVYLVGQYVQNKFENGYMLDGFLYINSNASPEQQDEYVREFERSYKGTKGKKIVFVFNDLASSEPKFIPIQDSLTNSVFKDYMHEATKQICFAHGASLNLLGLSNSDSFGSSNPDSNDINVSRMEYVANVIKPYQEDLIEGFNKLFEINGLGEATLLNETLKLTIPELQPSDTTVDERREIVLGLNPIGEPTNNIQPQPVA